MLAGATTGTVEHRGWVAEQEAAKAYDEALKLYRNGQTTTALERLQQIVQAHADTGARWRAQESAAHLLVKLGKADAAFEQFSEIVSSLAPKAPRSRIVATSLRRMAALRQREHDDRAAVEFYLAAAEASVTSETISENLLHAAGAFLKSHSKWTTPARSRPPKLGNRSGKSSSPHATLR
jgi:rubrerythrin